MTVETKNDATTAVAVAEPVDTEAPAGAGFAAVYDSPAAGAGAAEAGANDSNEDAGKKMGIAMLVLLVVGLVCTFTGPPIVSSLCYIVGIVLSSILTCGCGTRYDLRPNVRRFATATLVCLVLGIVLAVAFLVAAIATLGFPNGVPSNTARNDLEDAPVILVVIAILGLICNVMAIVFAALFTFGRKCCATS